jgi:hypothetical protein
MVMALIFAGDFPCVVYCGFVVMISWFFVMICWFFLSSPWLIFPSPIYNPKPLSS